jgi:hypothetical protein
VKPTVCKRYLNLNDRAGIELLAAAATFGSAVHDDP